VALNPEVKLSSGTAGRPQRHPLCRLINTLSGSHRPSSAAQTLAPASMRPLIQK
jgi:hypothetical protein